MVTTVAPRKPTLPDLIHWVEMQHADVELTEAEIERLLAIDEWIIEQEQEAVAS